MPDECKSGPAGVVVLDPDVGGAAAWAQDLAGAALAQDLAVTGLAWAEAAALWTLRPAILVLDPTRIPGGLDAGLDALRAACPGATLVAYASGANELLTRRCLERGFRGVVAREAGPERLARALAAVAAGGLWIDGLDGGGGAATRGLSRREALVERLSAMGWSRRRIAMELGLSLKSVDTYRARARRKPAAPDGGPETAEAPPEDGPVRA